MFEVLAALRHLSDTRPQDRAFMDMERALNYGELAERVGGLAKKLSALDSDTIAIFAPNCVEWVVADLSVAFAGKTMVPLPMFFSETQLTHILDNANVGHILTTSDTFDRAQTLGLPVSIVSLNGARAPLHPQHDRSRDAQRIIYTSGTTGAPKGVRLGDKQICASAKGLLAASGASSADRYLSLLPFSLLLEQIAAIALPLLAGAPVTLAPNVMMAALKGDTLPLMNAFETYDATASVLVPGLLEAWVKTLAATDNTAPKALRFVAVGGAPVNPGLAKMAWDLGVPVHEGYGLSECCSVVSVNRPGERIAGTAGHPIPGVDVTLNDGEIVVRSDTVMSGYLDQNNEPGGVWHTGDLGELSDEGALRILGRKDNLIVTQAGRNISPEWVESVCETNPDVAKSVLLHVEDHGLVLIVLPSPSYAPNPDRDDLLHDELAQLPDYARAAHIAIVGPAEVTEHELLTPLGDPRRAQCQTFAQQWLRTRV